jgi:hypothetical protein
VGFREAKSVVKLLVLTGEMPGLLVVRGAGSPSPRPGEPIFISLPADILMNN